MATSASEIVLENVGPIRKLNLAMASPGLYVLKGKNGSGKTTALEAASGLLGAKPKLTHRDGTTRGKVDGLGVTLSVTRARTSRSGELACESLEGKLNVSDLVDPGIADPERADARRIRALVTLTGCEPSPTLFVRCFGADRDTAAPLFESVVREDIGDSADLVEMADRIKRDCDKAALAQERSSDQAAAAAKASREQSGGIDLKAEDDETRLRAALEAAVRVDSRLTTERANAAEIARQAAEARQGLAGAEAAWTGLSVEQAGNIVQAAGAEAEAAAVEVERLEELLRLAKHRGAEASAAVESAHVAWNAAKAHEATLDAWRTSIEAAEVVTGPPVEWLAEAKAAVEAAGAALELGALVRQAKRTIAQAAQHEHLAKTAAKTAEQLRAAGRMTDQVLSDLVGASGVALRVDGGRLVTTTSRGDTLYSELSMGERWRLALDIAIAAGGPECLIPIPQEAFESLDPDNRRAVHEHVVLRGAYALAAEATEGELRAERFGEE